MNPEPPTLCTSPCTGLVLTDPCPECGHLAALHVGVEHCPVCDLAQHNEALRAGLAADRIEVHVAGVDARVLERTLERMAHEAAAFNRARRYR